VAERRDPRDARCAGAAPRRDVPTAPEIAAVQALERELSGQTVVAPGATTTAVLVTTSVVRSVELLFVGDSYAEGTLTRVR
jgi:hypothetical protein